MANILYHKRSIPLEYKMIEFHNSMIHVTLLIQACIPSKHSNLLEPDKNKVCSYQISCMNCVPYFQFVGGQHFLFDLLEPSLTYRGFCHHPHGILQMINFNFTKHHSYTLNNTRIIIYPHYNFLYVQCLIIYNGFLQYLYWYNV